MPSRVPNKFKILSIILILIPPKEKHFHHQKKFPLKTLTVFKINLKIKAMEWFSWPRRILLKATIFLAWFIRANIS